MDSNHILDVQHQIRESSEDVQKYLLDLDSWEKEMKKKEEELKLIQTSPEEEIPPIRNSLYRSKKKNRHKKQKDKVSPSNKTNNSTIDYKAWEKFDADAELKKIDEETKQSSASENSENEEDEFCVQRRKQLAILHKDKGNEFFKKGNYDSAINSYTTGLQLDPENPLLAANRAMAFLKKDQFQVAENDCTLCLSIDPTYVKAYLRRGTARKNLNKFLLAKADFSKVLELEPENKQAQEELKKMSEISAVEDTTSISESEVFKAQEVWPKILVNKAVDHIEEPVQKVKEIKLPKEENDCIFPDCYPVSLGKDLSSINDLGPSTEVRILEEDEDNFVNMVENSLNEFNISASSETSQLEQQPETIIPKPSLPPVPTTSFQFLADWTEIASYPDLRYQYLKQFNPEQLPIFFKHYMEPTIFSLILETLSTSFIEHGDDVFDYMKYLTGIGRFNVLVIFLSGKEENDLKKLLECLKASGRPESEVSAVLNKYEA